MAAGGGRAGRRLRGVLLPALLLLCSGGPGRGQEAGHDVETLQGLVAELLALHAAENEEENRWREEGARLGSALALAKKERALLREKLASVQEQEDSAGEERGRLEESIARGEAVLARVDESVRRAAARLLAVHRSLPEPLHEQLLSGATRLTELLASKADPLGTNDRLRLVNAFSADLDRLLGSVHAAKQLLAFADPDRGGAEALELDVLYLGAAIGYWVRADDRGAGMLVREGGTFRMLRRDDLASAVRRAIEIAGKRRPAEIVPLPLPGAGR